MGPVDHLLPALWSRGAAQKPDVSIPPRPGPASQAPTTPRSPDAPGSGPQTSDNWRNLASPQATGSGKGQPTSRSCFPSGESGAPGGPEVRFRGRDRAVGERRTEDTRAWWCQGLIFGTRRRGRAMTSFISPTPQVWGPRAHQARHVWLWEGALRLAAAPEPQAAQDLVWT